MKKKLNLKPSNPVAKDLMTPKYSQKKVEDKRKKNPRHRKNFKYMDEASNEKIDVLKKRYEFHRNKARDFDVGLNKARKRRGIPKNKLNFLANAREVHHQLALEAGKKLKELGGDMTKNIKEAVLKPGRRYITMKSPFGSVGHYSPKRASQLAKMGFVSVQEQIADYESPLKEEISTLIEMKLMELAEKTRKIFGDELFEQIDFFEFLEMLEEEYMSRRGERKSPKHDEDDEDEEKENMLKPHVIIQIKKHMDTKSDPEEMLPIKFHDGETKEVSLKHMRKANAMYNLFKPEQKEYLGNKLNASHSSFLRAIGVGK